MKYFLLAAGLISSAAYAQTPSSDYVLQLSSVIGNTLTNTLQMGAPQMNTVNGCQYTTVQDGAVLCFIGDSCNSQGLPDCGILFTGPSGLKTTDVAALSSISSTPGAAGPSGTPSATPSSSPSSAPGTTPTASPYRTSSTSVIEAAVNAMRR